MGNSVDLIGIESDSGFGSDCQVRQTSSAEKGVPDRECENEVQPEIFPWVPWGLLVVCLSKQEEAENDVGNESEPEAGCRIEILAA